MGNIIGSFFSGFAKVVGNLFGHPMEFLSGKSCDSVCPTSWDLICYIENFCVANVLKLLMVLALLYIVLLFFYLLHKTGVCYCIGRSLCKMIWACFAACFYACEYGCTFLCYNMRKLKRVNGRRHRREFYHQDDYINDDEESISYSPLRSIELTRSLSRRSRKIRKSHLETSLRPRSHRIRVGISRNAAFVNHTTNPVKHHKHNSTLHNIRVTKTSKFVKKGANIPNRSHHRRPRP
ncbi:hypothetical protein AQUCO_01400256v1 [Aquilegia coerulea]|uniref:Uncharacterized protein n=1 Tax=Aquilegia coerulea TaxID=218851 RepID=A0A2G5DVE7_AQUCA|nr:hypothetical protein AQUCO_01400256v1 [Aquilegia coerulea]